MLLTVAALAGVALIAAGDAGRGLAGTAKPPAAQVVAGVRGHAAALLIALLWYPSALWYYNGFSVPI